MRDKTAVTICFPGAKVGDLLESIPSLLAKHPLARNIIIHIECNDISAEKSEILKRDFTCLFNLLNDCGKCVFISGPIPSLKSGVNRFSRLLALHTWL